MNSLFICTLLFFSTIQTNTGSYIRFTGLRNFNPPIYTAYNYISINNYRFNPREKLPDIPAELKAASDYYLVQFQGPVYEDMKKQAELCGVKIIQYVPYNTFIVRMNASVKTVVERLSFVTWIGNYEPAYKISPLFKQMPDEKQMLVILFYDENIEQTAEEIKNIGCEILEVSTTEYNKIIKVNARHDKLVHLTQIPAVMYIEPWFKPQLCNNNAQWVTQTWQQQNRRIWRKGLYGRGQVVNTADTGILTSHDMFRDSSVSITTWGDYPDHRKIIAYRTWPGSSATFGDNSSAAWHGTHTAGTICGNDEPVAGSSTYDGIPPLAKMYFMDCGNESGGFWPADLTNLYTLPYNGNTAGAARISSHSWGTASGTSYNSYCQQTDNFMWNHKDFLIFYAAGSNGPGASTIYPPANSKDIVTVGTTYNSTQANIMADFSSRGPTNDNRYKPTVTAPGYFLYSSVGPNNNSYLGMGGTSMSTPCAAGSAVLIREYFARGLYPTGDSTPGNAWAYISAALVKACLINGASPQINGLTIPDNNTGWGRVLLDDVLYFTGDIRKLAVVDDTVGIATAEYQEYIVSVNNESEPLKIALVWTDYPAVAGANPAIVNNLDLEVIAPDGTHYRGNKYTNGQSTPNPTVWDTLNVEECARVNIPVLGDWTIRVYGANIPQGPRQSFALAVSGGLGPIAEPVLHISQSVMQDPFSGFIIPRLIPGISVYLTDYLRNRSAAAAVNCSGILKTTCPYVSIAESIGYFGTIPADGTGSNAASRFRFAVSSVAPQGIFADFTIHLSGDGGYSQDIDFGMIIGIGDDAVIIWGPKQVQIAPGDTQFLYGVTYRPADDRIYVTNIYAKKIYMYTSDSNVVYLGYIPAPETLCTDIKYCAYDNSFWVAANPNQPYPTGKKILKISPSGTILRQFANPANDYPTGLAWLEPQRLLYLADRRAASNNPPEYIYCSDTLGAGTQITLPMTGNLGARCLESDPYGITDTTLILIYTWFNASATAMDSVGLYELYRSDGGIKDRVLFPGWNARGVGIDPRNGDFWITIPQNPGRSIVKILGFHGVPVIGIAEEKSAGTLSGIALASGYPNPFNKHAVISYTLPASVKITLTIYDIAGRQVATLADGVEGPGVKSVAWDGRTANGARAAAGVYFCRLETNRGSLVRKIVLTR